MIINTSDIETARKTIAAKESFRKKNVDAFIDMLDAILTTIDGNKATFDFYNKEFTLTDAHRKMMDLYLVGEGIDIMNGKECFEKVNEYSIDDWCVYISMMYDC
jgi:uncharacterized protein YkvS